MQEKLYERRKRRAATRLLTSSVHKRVKHSRSPYADAFSFMCVVNGPREREREREKPWADVVDPCLAGSETPDSSPWMNLRFALFLLRFLTRVFQHSSFFLSLLSLSSYVIFIRLFSLARDLFSQDPAVHLDLFSARRFVRDSRTRGTELFSSSLQKRILKADLVVF